MTRVLLDTNVIISALLFPGSTPDQVVRLVLDEYDLVTDWIIEELRAVVLRKRPDVLPHAQALGTIARSGNLSELARNVGMSREGLYKALSAEGNPSFATISKVARALGLRIHFEAVA